MDYLMTPLRKELEGRIRCGQQIPFIRRCILSALTDETQSGR
jgi:hypothetical protein